MQAKQLRDPVHFFNGEGVSVLTLQHLSDRVQQLEGEVERLTRLLRAQVEQNKAYRMAADTPKLHS